MRLILKFTVTILLLSYSLFAIAQSTNVQATKKSSYNKKAKLKKVMPARICSLRSGKWKGSYRTILNKRGVVHVSIKIDRNGKLTGKYHADKKKPEKIKGSCRGNKISINNTLTGKLKGKIIYLKNFLVAVKLYPM